MEITHRYVGTVLIVDTLCVDNHRHQWCSSGSTRGIFNNNLIICAAILFSGNNFQKITQLAKICSLKLVCPRTFFMIQKSYLYPSIDDYYSRCQKIIFNNLKGVSCIVAGDGQMDSPGFCAKQCVYTFMDAVNYYVLHIENVDVREAQLKSTVMEKIGCSRALRYLMEHTTITEVVTDSNSQIIKMLSKCVIFLLCMCFIYSVANSWNLKKYFIADTILFASFCLCFIFVVLCCIRNHPPSFHFQK